MLYLAFLQTTTATTTQAEAGSPCLTAVVTWAPFLLLIAFFFFLSRRMGYFSSKRGGYMGRHEPFNGNTALGG